MCWCRFVWGRGAIDVKFGVTALLEAVSQLLARGRAPSLMHFPATSLVSSVARRFAVSYAITVPICLDDYSACYCWQCAFQNMHATG